jgi:hypothetical protein
MPLPAAATPIVADAFRFMEMAPPSSFADDTPQAQDAAAAWPVVLDMTLEALDWSFASVLRMLPAAAVPDPAEADPDLPWLYPLPGDCLVVREAGEAGTRWRRDRAGLRADAPAPLRVRYTARIDPALTPAAFREVLALRLALRLAPRWMGVASKIEAIEARLTRTLRDAARADARHASPASWSGGAPADDWTAEARL